MTSTEFSPSSCRIRPYLVVEDAARAIDVYQSVFGFSEVYRLPMDGRVGHAELELDGAKLHLSSEFPEANAVGPNTLKGTPVGILVYVDGVEDVLARALEEGFTQDGEMKNEFYGDRTVKLRDPFGHLWFVHQRVENLTPAEIRERFEAISSDPTC